MLHAETYSYDAQGNPMKIGSSLGAITLTYDATSPGKLTKITDARAKITGYG